MDTNIYEVEDIVGKKKEEEVFYLIKWKGYPASQNTWERRADLYCADMVENYEKKENETYKHFKNILGLSIQIIQLENNIILPLTDKKKFKNLGIPEVKGVILYGPTGNGKSSLVEACARRSKSNIINIDCNLFLDMSKDNAIKTIRDAFKLAEEHAPAIILIDNLSETGIKRFESREHDDVNVNSIKSELLHHIDSLSIDKNIKIIAESNIGLLDPDFLQTGRLDCKIEVPRPNAEARKLILEYYGKIANTSDTVNFKELSVYTSDYSAVQCKYICEKSKILAHHRGSLIVTREDLLRAISQEIP